MGIKVIQALPMGSVVGISAAGRLLKSGQTTAYNVAGRTSVSDGDTEYGLNQSFTNLTTGQYSGTTGITVNAKTDTHTNACVYDQKTGITWNRDPSASVGPANNGLLFYDDTGGSDEDAYAFCDAANAASLSGHSDWRLPNVTEGWSLVLGETGPPYINQTYFPNVVSGYIVTSTTYKPATTSYIAIAFTAGIMVSRVKTTNSNFVMLCRGGTTT